MATQIRASFPGDYVNNGGEDQGLTDVYLGFSSQSATVEINCLAADFVLEVDKDDLLEALRIIGLLPNPAGEGEEISD